VFQGSVGSSRGAATVSFMPACQQKCTTVIQGHHATFSAQGQKIMFGAEFAMSSLACPAVGVPVSCCGHLG